MTGEHESSNQGDRRLRGRGSVSVPCVKGPLGFLLKATARQTTDETDSWDNAYKGEYISKALRAFKSLCALMLLLLLLMKSNPG